MTTHCTHCGRQSETDERTSDRWFCCTGCMMAWNLIHELGLAGFYQLPRPSGSISLPNIAACNLPGQSRSQVSPSIEALYASWDSSVFQQRTCTRAEVKAANGEISDSLSIRVQLAEISCYACVWLCEGAIASQFPGARFAVNLSTSSGTLNFDPAQHRLSAMMGLLHKLGYQPTVQDTVLSPRLQRTQLIRLGVAGACALNVMALAAADYVAPASGPGQLSPEFAQAFRWLSLLLTLPAITYSASPFYLSAWRQIKSGRLAIDQGITVALLTGFAASVYATISRVGPVYFDSLCSGITLLLAGRMILANVMGRAERSVGASPFDLGHHLVRCLTVGKNEPEYRELEQIKAGQVFDVLPGEMIPLHSRVISGDGQINLEPITGEPRSVLAHPGGLVPACAQNGSTVLHLVAEEDGNSSFWRQTQNRIMTLMSAKGRASLLAERVATWFYAAVVVGTGLFFLVATQGSNLGITETTMRAVAGLLIACPCAFGFAAPLCYASSAKRALKVGVAFRNIGAMENLRRTSKIFFDKTGTLTEIQRESREITYAPQVVALDMARLIIPLASSSSHRWGALLRESLSEQYPNLPRLNVEEFVEIPGKGSQGRVGDHLIRIGRHDFVSTTSERLSAWSEPSQTETVWDTTWISVDGEVIAKGRVRDLAVPDAAATISWLSQKHIPATILSGDRQDRVAALADQTGIAGGLGGLLPEEKAAHIQRAERSIAVMVGNGVNDSPAMAGAPISIAVFDAAPAAKAAADIAFMAPGIGLLRKAFEASEGLHRSIVLTFGFALIYNLTGLASAWLGLVSPGVAALAMPLSSLIVIRLATLPLRRQTRCA